MPVLALLSCAQPRSVRQRQPQPELIAQIDSIGTSALGEISGLSIAVSRPHEPLIVRTFGLADRERQIAVTADTPFRIASSSKQFVAFAILTLVEERVLDLDENVARYLPNFPLQGHRVTLRHLLSHTSGIAEHVGEPGTDTVFAQYATSEVPLDAIISIFASRPFDFTPGARWSYSNSGYVLLVAVIERMTGMTYGEYLRRKIFEPMALDHTSICETTTRGLASGYTRSDHGFVAAPPHINGSMAGGGFVCSTAGDLIRWQRQLHRSSVAATMVTATRLNDGTIVPYGFAMSIGEIDGHRALAHGGGDQDIRASVSYFPDDDVVVIALANTGSDVLFDVARRAAGAALGIPKPLLLDLPVDDTLAQALAGTYVVAQGWTWSFTHASTGTTARSEEGGPIRIAHQGKGVFVAPSHPGLRFEFANDGGIGRSVVVDQFGMRFLGIRAEANRRPQ